ncbi:class I adenylate-forming enzyme family protein [Novosphingobium lentum]|uniref:class I adenylate-forming enzyme family protein n=1 Tax=Novosphingobium lentum TaxID=145287 RepID=UPI000831731E|nr:AMP-binding protein [Novosphingobium lentum]
MQIGSIIRRAALQFKDAPCLTEGGRTLSFREFDQATDRLGHALIAKGLRPGDRVGVLLPNSIDCLIAYYAVFKAGLVRVQLNVRETLETHVYKIGYSGCRAVIHDSVEGIAVEMPILFDELLDMIATGRDAPCAVDRDLDAPLRLGFTGGTTGKSKAVTLTTRTDLVETSVFLSDLIPELAEGEIFLHGAPVAHAGGAYFLPSLIRGVHSVIMTKFDTAGYLALAEATQAAYTFLVPTMLAMVLDDPAIDTAKTAFRIISYGASSISPNVMGRAEKRFGRVFAQCYGQAESPMAITYLRPEHHDRIGSCGRPFSVVEVAVFDDDDQPLPPGERGEIVCRGPQTMAFYWDKPEETAKVFRNGWLHTGDIGVMDEDGFFYIVDRKNDMLISGGYNVYPREVEDVLMEYPGVSEAAVVGLPDEKWGDRVVAVVAGPPGLDAAAIEAFARDRLSGVKRPRQVHVWDELPKSGANKILRRSVRDRLIQAMGVPVDE